MLFSPSAMYLRLDPEGAIANSYEVPLAELLATLNTWHARYARR